MAAGLGATLTALILAAGLAAGDAAFFPTDSAASWLSASFSTCGTHFRTAWLSHRPRRTLPLAFLVAAPLDLVCFGAAWTASPSTLLSSLPLLPLSAAPLSASSSSLGPRFFPSSKRYTNERTKHCTFMVTDLRDAASSCPPLRWDMSEKPPSNTALFGVIFFAWLSGWLCEMRGVRSLPSRETKRSAGKRTERNPGVSQYAPPGQSVHRSVHLPFIYCPSAQ